MDTACAINLLIIAILLILNRGAEQMASCRKIGVGTLRNTEIMMVRTTLTILALAVCVPRATIAQEIEHVALKAALVGVGMALPSSRAPLVLAACTLSHQECTYECFQWYPNGTDCLKSKKICKTVCDQFDVKPSGETPHIPFRR